MEERPKFKKTERLSWDDFFMQVAFTTAKRVACNYHKIASVFVDEGKRIVSIGYNGPSAGDYHCNEVGCAKIHGDPITGELRRCRGAHSEMNAIVNCGDTMRLQNSTLYITTFPCYDCMKVLVNAGVKRIVYGEEYRRIADGSKAPEKTIAEPEAKELALRRNIVLEKYEHKPENKKEKDVEATPSKVSEKLSLGQGQRW